MAHTARKYKVLIDVRTLAGRLTGMGRYATKLLDEMLDLSDHDLELHALCLPDDKVPEAIPRHVLRGIEARPMRPEQQVVVPWAILGSRCDLYHYPSYDPPLCPGRPLVTTCADVEPIRMPELFPPKIVWYYKLLAARLRRAAKVIVISEHTGKDIVELLGIDPERVRPIHLGVGSHFRPISDGQCLAGFRSRYRLPDRFLLYVGNTMAHKNLPRLVAAMAIVANKFPSVPLLIAGGKDKYRPVVESAIEAARLEEKVKFLGPVPEEDLPALYSSASVFVYPSLYEGFGLPVLEAMACGTPVVTSNAASIPEIVGGAGIMVDPCRYTDIADGILRILENDEDAARFSQLGVRRAGDFTWRRCAEKHLQVYQEVLGKR